MDFSTLSPPTYSSCIFVGLSPPYCTTQAQVLADNLFGVQVPSDYYGFYVRSLSPTTLTLQATRKTNYNTTIILNQDGAWSGTSPYVPTTSD
jgi:hypothetical protein